MVKTALVPWRSCLGYRHACCLQLSHRWPPEMCGLWTRIFGSMDWRRWPDWRRSDMPPSNCHRRRAYRLSPSPGGDTLLSLSNRDVKVARPNRARDQRFSLDLEVFRGSFNSLPNQTKTYCQNEGDTHIQGVSIFAKTRSGTIPLIPFPRVLLLFPLFSHFSLPHRPLNPARESTG